MSPALTLLSPAKLNLFLHITGRRADGYHELQTLFQLLDWGDTLQFLADDSGSIRLTGDTLDIAPEHNLIMRAARALSHATAGKGAAGKGATIHVEKRIPAGGGLGGGSSNAATTLLALNQLWQLRLTPAELQTIARRLGADVPVFVAGHTAWAEGIGDKLSPMELPPHWYLVIAPGCNVSTEQVFSHRQLTRDTSPIKMAAFFEGRSRNDCQAIVRGLYPEVDKALNWLEKFGEARMTGTGACVFCSFPDKYSASSALGQLPRQMAGFVAQGVNASPVHAALARPND